MLAKVEVWERNNAKSAQPFAQKLEEKIKETKQKLDRLVKTFLDGTIEKKIYLVKRFALPRKMNLSKPKPPFWKRKAILDKRETVGSSHCGSG